MEQENKQELNPQEVQPPRPAAPLSEGAYPFRGAAFGGFQRQDVLDYLKKSQEANRQEMLSVQEALASVQIQWEAERQRAQESEQAREDAVRSAAERASQLHQAQRALSEAQGALEQTQSEKTALEDQIAWLQEELATLRPQAEAYLRLRERTTTIELNAHARAQGIVDQAQEERAQVRKKYVEWAQAMNEEYQKLRKDVGLTFGKAAQELERVCRTLERTAEEMDLHEEEIQKFLAQAEMDRPESAELPT